jgi:hypothetical protein
VASWTKLGIRSVKAAGMSATEAAPVDPSDGMDISGVRSFSLTLECDLGQSFSTAAGQLDVWWWDPIVGAWSLVPESYKPIPPEAVGRRRFTMVLDVINARGQLALIPNGLSLSGGTLTQFYATVTSSQQGTPA